MFKKIQAFIQLLRLGEFYGNTLAITFIGGVFNQNLPSLKDLVLFIIISNLTTAFAFAINDIEDANDDAKDPAKAKRNPISAKRLNLTEANIFAYLLAVLAMFLTIPYGTFALLVVSAGLILGFLYSYKPVRLKSMPVVDLISHGLFLGVAQFLLPAIAFNSPVTSTMLLAGVGIFGVSVLGDLRNEIRDYKVDRQTKINNTAAVINVRAIAPYLEYLYAVPMVVVGLVLTVILPESRRLIFVGGIFIALFIYWLLPKPMRNKLAAEYTNQIPNTIGGILAYLLFYPNPFINL